MLDAAKSDPDSESNNWSDHNEETDNSAVKPELELATGDRSPHSDYIAGNSFPRGKYSTTCKSLQGNSDHKTKDSPENSDNTELTLSSEVETQDCDFKNRGEKEKISFETKLVDDNVVTENCYTSNSAVIQTTVKDMEDNNDSANVGDGECENEVSNHIFIGDDENLLSEGNENMFSVDEDNFNNDKPGEEASSHDMFSGGEDSSQSAAEKEKGQGNLRYTFFQIWYGSVP